MQIDPSAAAAAAQPPQLTSPALAAPPVLPPRLGHLLCLDDFEHAARRHLPGPLFAYVSGGVERNQSLHGNRSAYEEYDFLTRVLVDCTRRSPATTLLGRRYSAPFGIAPMGICALTADRGDIVLAESAGCENVPFILSGASLTRLEVVARAHPEAWFQIYLPGDEANRTALVERVQMAGYRTLVVTVDTPTHGNRENNVRAGFSTPLRPSVRLAWEGISHPRWLLGTFLKTLARDGMPHFENAHAHRGAPILSPTAQRDLSERGNVTWPDLRKLRQQWRGQLVVKGILDPRDARIAVDQGADGIIVSNHGGRQLDGAVAPLRVLPQVVAACPEVPVMIDSGIRRGSDVLKAIALGAKFAFVGRPFNYAAAVGGHAGVRRAITLLRDEVSRNMAMLGVSTLDQLDASYVVKRGG